MLGNFAFYAREIWDSEAPHAAWDGNGQKEGNNSDDDVRIPTAAWDGNWRKKGNDSDDDVPIPDGGYPVD